MEFVKRHYEKILLSVVLLGLAGAAAWLPFAINKAKEDLEKAMNPAIGLEGKFEPVNLSKYLATMNRIKKPAPLEFSGDHNLFNAVTWRSNNLAQLFKVKSEADAITVLKINPLYLTLSFDRVAGNGYWVGVSQENDLRSRGKPIPKYAKVNEKTDLFTIREAKGTAEDPELKLELNDTKEQILISKAKPYKRIEGRATDLKYVPDNKSQNDLRVNQTVSFGGETYKIIAITENAVRVQAVSNQKQFTLPWTGSR